MLQDYYILAMGLLVFTLTLLYFIIPPTNLQLLINVKNLGGDVVLENITANVVEDTVTIEFLRLDGVFVSQLIDFTNEVEAMKFIIPGEEELGESGYQTLCFLSPATQADFIAPDAMAKLRQKNPGTVRIAEEDKGWRQTITTAWAGRATRLLSPPAARHCATARDQVFLRAADLTRWPPRRAGAEPYSSAVTAFPEQVGTGGGRPVGARDPVPACIFPASDECICNLEECINWYPCGLKYCKGKPQGGMSYRCGIKTCRRCYRYHYYVSHSSSCPRLS